MAADLADNEAAKIGAAAERKQRAEGEASIEAILKSDASGKAVYWRRRIGDRESLEVERAGTYPPRRFLALAEKAAGQAGKGYWNRPQAVEAVAAELVMKVMAKTGGTMPKVGSLGRDHDGHENPDLAYLTASARRLIVSAMRGDAAAAGLAAEAAPTGDALDQQDADRDLAELMGEAEAAAEGPRDPYLADAAEGADLLNPQVREGARVLAQVAGKREDACMAAITSSLRAPVAKSADLAHSGYGSSPAAARKAAQRGRDVLRPVIAGILRERAEKVSDDDAEFLAGRVALAFLCENEDRDHAPRHVMEDTAHKPYRALKIDWPTVTQPEEISPITVYTATQPDWRTA